MTLRVLPPLADAAYREFRRQAIFSCHKWDPQVEDVATIAPFALALPAQEWRILGGWAEQLAAETVAMEAALWQRSDCDLALGLPWPLRLALRAGRRRGAPVAAARVMRFDFHPTPTGWSLSEVNSDVPGGYNEATGLTALMAERHPSLRKAGDPTTLLARRIAAVAGNRPVAMVHCSAYSDDRQVIEFLADSLRALGATCLACAPDAIRWRGAEAFSADGCPFGAVVRFFPAEWLSQLPMRSRWWRFFAGRGTPAMNPGAALLVQSKRLPLLWDRLGVPCPAWRALLPETRTVQSIGSWDDGWLLKPTWGRVGEGVLGPGFGAQREWEKARRSARRWPRGWIAQRRFVSQPLTGPHGPVHTCLGVYTVDGVAAGIYGRVCARPPIDKLAQEVAVLIDDAGPSSTGQVPVASCSFDRGAA